MSPIDDPVKREAFSQSCQMYRQFVMMRYYELTTCAITNAALIALYFQYRALDNTQSGLIRTVGAIIALACIGIELRIAQLIDFYEKAMGRFADDLKISPIVVRSLGFGFITIASALSIVIYLCAAVSWIFFAYPPPRA